MNKVKLLFVLGVISWLAAGSVLATKIVQAASYTEVWSANGYRSIRAVNKNNATQSTPWVCVGPANWSVSFYQDGRLAIQENWEALAWRDTFNQISSAPASDLKFEYQTSASCNNTDGGWGPNSFPWVLHPVGLYGVWVLQWQGGFENFHKSHFAAAKSWPYIWRISGTINE